MNAMDDDTTTECSELSFLLRTLVAYSEDIDGMSEPPDSQDDENV